MRFIKTFLVMTLIVSQAQANVSHEDKVLVVAEIIKLYSQGADDDRFEMTEDDVWSLKYLKETSTSCPILVQAYANKPSYQGSSLYQVYVCVKFAPNGAKYAELVDEVQIADE